MMEPGAKLLRRSPADSPLVVWVGRGLLAVSLLGLTLLAPSRARAQATPHLAISMSIEELEDPDRTREGWQIANLGTTPLDVNNYWLCRIADSLTPVAGFVRITGVDPVPPGGVLDIEWNRPIPASDIDIPCTTKGNVFCSGRTFADGSDFNSSDLVSTQALAIFAPTTGNTPPTVANGTMVAYFFQGDLASIDKDADGYNKAVQAKLWTDGDATEKGPTPSDPSVGDPTTGPQAEDWALSLRMGPDPYPAGHGSHAADYFHSLINIPTVDSVGVSLEGPAGMWLTSLPNAGSAPNQRRRAGLWTQPTYQWGNSGTNVLPPIPGQIPAGIYAVRTPQAVTASLAANSPATGMVVAAIDKNGAVWASVQSNNQWSPWAKLTGPAADGFTLIDNPKTLSRTLLVRSSSDGKLFGATGPTDGKVPFTGITALADLGAAVQFAPAAVEDPATGNEYYVAVQAGTKAVLFNEATNTNGSLKLGAWQTVAGLTTDAPVAAAWIPDTNQVAVVAWNGNQLALALADASGKFGAWQNVGAAVSARPAGIGPVAAWNPIAKNLEMIATTGTISNDPGADDGKDNSPTFVGTSQPGADIQHARAQISRTATTIGALAKVAGVSTMVAPAIAVDTGTGNIRMLEREGAGHEPGPVFGQEAANGTADFAGSIHQGFVFESTFDGTKWGTPTRVGVAALPGPSAATPLFKTAVSPVTVFDANTKKFEDILLGQDAQVYVVPVP